MPTDWKPPKRVKDPGLMARLHLQRGNCAVCGTDQQLELHHLRRRSQGGGDTRENLRFMCREHHTAFHNGTLGADLVKRLWRSPALEDPGGRPSLLPPGS